MQSTASIFSKRPKTWGYRGDPFLWDALGWELSTKLARVRLRSQSDSLIEQLLFESFEALISSGEQSGDGVELHWLPKGGMSGSVIHLQTWENVLLPEIIDRVRDNSTLNKFELEYHPAEHRFRFAAWAAATAARSSRRVCTFPVSEGAKLLRTSDLRWIALGSHWLPGSRPEFDKRHQAWCENILRLGQSHISKAFTYGIAAKLVNCYLKALFVQTMAGSPFDPYGDRRVADSNSSTRFLHPPIDRVLMAEAARRAVPEIRRGWKRLLDIGWSRFSSDDYSEAIRLSREMVGDDVAQIEACWIGYQ